MFIFKIYSCKYFVAGLLKIGKIALKNVHIFRDCLISARADVNQHVLMRSDTRLVLVVT